MWQSSVREIGKRIVSGTGCVDVDRFLWMDIPLKDVDEPCKDARGYVATERSASSAAVFANKDVALLICRKLDQWTLGRIAQCSRTLRTVAERARREFVQRSVFNVKEQVDESVSAAELCAAHYSASMLRLSAVYGPVQEPPVRVANEAFVVDDMDMEAPHGPHGPQRFVEKILLEVRAGDKQAMAWCKLPRKNQIRVSRPMFMD
jgi:hypothetical protein